MDVKSEETRATICSWDRAGRVGVGTCQRPGSLPPQLSQPPVPSSEPPASWDCFSLSFICLVLFAFRFVSSPHLLFSGFKWQ